MDGFLNSVGRFLTSKSVGKKTPTVRIYKHVIFATGGAWTRIRRASAWHHLIRLLAGKR